MASENKLQTEVSDEPGSDMDLLTKLQNETLDGANLSADAKTMTDCGSDVISSHQSSGDVLLSTEVSVVALSDTRNKSYTEDGQDVVNINSSLSPDEHTTSQNGDISNNVDKHKSDDVTKSADVLDGVEDEEPMDVISTSGELDVDDVIRDIGELNQIAEPMLRRNDEQVMDVDNPVEMVEEDQSTMEVTQHSIRKEETIEPEHLKVRNMLKDKCGTATLDDLQRQQLTSFGERSEEVLAGLDEVDNQDHSEPGDRSQGNETGSPGRRRSADEIGDGEGVTIVSDIKQEVEDDVSHHAGDQLDCDISPDIDHTSPASEQQVMENVDASTSYVRKANPPLVQLLHASPDDSDGQASKTDSASKSSDIQSKEDDDDDEDVSFIGEESSVKSTESVHSKNQEKIVDCSSSTIKDVIKESFTKTTHCCLVCNKVAICKYNIVRNNCEKHLCDDACFGKFRMTPTLFLLPEKVEQSRVDSANDDGVEIVRMTPPLPKLMTAPTARVIACVVCNKKKPVKHEVSVNRKMLSLCSEKCFSSFRLTNKLSIQPCGNCGAYCIEHTVPSSTTERINFEGGTKNFCGTICLHAFRSKNKKMVSCAWCKAKKSNFDMVERIDVNNTTQLFCSLNCLSLYRVNMQAMSNQEVKCDQCTTFAPAQYHLTMSDASIRNFCSYPCVINFQSQFGEPVNVDQPQPVERMSSQMANTRQSIRHSPRVATRQSQDEVPVISDVVSLAQKAPEVKISSVQSSSSAGVQTTHIIIQPPKPQHVKNKALLCKPLCQTKATSCRPHMQTKSTQTEGEYKQDKILIPVPVPIYVPTPMAMFAAPQPYPLPIPVPIPIPCFIPTTKKSADSILKQIKEIREQMPADPFEAELLMMAEAVATAEQSESDTSEEEDEEIEEVAPLPTETLKFQPNPEVTTTTTTQPNELGEDMLQMALRMASEISEEPVLDLEDSLNPAPIQPMSQEEASEFSTIDQSSDILTNSPRETSRGRRGKRGRGRGRPKRPRLSEESLVSTPEPVVMEPKPAADANMVLKYTYGVNAWKHWVAQKNSVLEKIPSTKSKAKQFKIDILACTTEELNYSLCLFVKEVRKPNGEEYAPDSIFYLCLGIQQYLYENGRIDDIFSSFYYEGFTNALNEVLAGYEIRLNAHGLLVCRIEEEHLWESKQLGAHSPYILLNTLIYFNTKYFFLKTPEEHLRLSFSHIMKHWKRANGQPVTAKQPAQGQAKNVYLRYYAPPITGPPEPGQKRKREEAPVYEQAENTDNPLRCPVKLYEFYLSKCPESIKHRNDVFYLLPERSCVPDSPVWYSTNALSLETMTKMLNRLRLVREIQEAHLHNAPSHYGI